MNRVQTLAHSPLVTLLRFDHPSHTPHHDPEEESVGRYYISFVQRGSFALQVGRRSWQLTPGMAFLTGPGLVYRYRHEQEAPTDVCLSVGYDDDFVEDIRRSANLKKCRRMAASAPTNQLAYLRLRLAQLAADGGDTLAVETLAGELFPALAAGKTAGGAKLYKNRQLAWYAERVEAARSLLGTHYAEQHSLASLARAVGVSPFHFARVFRELTGTPPHRYLLRVRLTRAAQRLRQGASVTDTCFATGFNSLSHFSHLFRRRYGVSPSQLPLKRLP